MATLSQVRPEMRPYRPYGTAQDILYSRDNEIVLSGPAGTGKSRAELEKLHLCAMKYPGMRGLIARKTRASLTEAGLVTWESNVLPIGSPIASGAQRRQRQAYHYPNGSEIIVGGLDKPEKVMSTEYDMIYVQEAIELSETDWESLTTRLRNGVMPYQQLIADTNPSYPLHWLKQRANRGATRMLDCRHEDNPRWWDHEKGCWTPEGLVYLARLEALTGVRKQRLRHGKWVAAEGQIYEEWNAAVHMISWWDPPRDWPRYWVVDFGFTNPFVWQAWAKDPDGRLYRYREIYRTQRLVEDHALDILEVTKGDPRPVAVICDHDAEDRATLERYLKMETIPAYKSVSPGIQAVKGRMRVAGDGEPRLYLMRDSLVEVDEALVEAMKPTCTEQEVDGYIWDTANGRKKGEAPVKEDDHGQDAERYLVAHVDGLAPPPKPKTVGIRPTMSGFSRR